MSNHNVVFCYEDSQILSLKQWMLNISQIDLKVIYTNRLKALGIVDEVIKEPLGGAHRDIQKTASEIKTTLVHLFSELSALEDDERNNQRYQKLTAFGVFQE